MKFSVKPIYSNSTSLRPTNYRASWESSAVGVEYLFMGDGSQNIGQITYENHDFISVIIDGLNAKPQLDTRSGRYRQRDAVPK
ncbi:hypothetical protein [Nostoc sp. TCL26-01]|uniref:hypothetical protein n=1 Tax=Nostoc sp. TCL26-01 TaxID=2576904 RepID=UPI0015C04A29|nr:hypothetical protein [Nostoc sp. TCL26-01]QLE55311.1 hypothetical protein FD725_07165 [Nostoc sp. TCL26-01]